MSGVQWMALFPAALLATDVPTYCWGFLNAHPERREIPEAEAMEIQKGHLAHMGNMARMGRLIAAGPMLTPGGPRGVVVYECDSTEQAKAWTEPDPAVVNKRLVVEMYRWQPTGVFGEPLASKRKADPAYKYSMVKLPVAVLTRTPETGTGLPPENALKEHLASASGLERTGDLRTSGRFLDAPEKMALFIFAEIAPERAQALAAGDPLVKEGWATAKVFVWMAADESVPNNIAIPAPQAPAPRP
jgi:uncharacterized protein YciI